MDRVRALVEKLNTQLHQNEDKASLIVTAQQLLTELGGAVSAKPLPQNIYEESTRPTPELPIVVTNSVAEITPASQAQETSLSEVDISLPTTPEPAITTTSQISFEETPHTPKEDLKKAALVNTDAIIEKKEVKDHLVLEPIKDLRSAIGINDKFQFIQELFGGDEKSFEVAIKTINAFKIFPEAQFYIKRELREKNNWDEENEVVKQFDQLVKRRFS